MKRSNIQVLKFKETAGIQSDSEGEDGDDDRSTALHGVREETTYGRTNLVCKSPSNPAGVAMHGSLIREVDAELEQSIEFALAYDDFGMMKEVRQTEVTFITSMAGKLGYGGLADETWANFGQGAPETGPIEDAPKRDLTVNLTVENLE